MREELQHEARVALIAPMGPAHCTVRGRVPWPAGGWLEVYSPSRSRPQPRQEPFGAEAWLLDPEGNRLLLLVLP